MNLPHSLHQHHNHQRGRSGAPNHSFFHHDGHLHRRCRCNHYPCSECFMQLSRDSSGYGQLGCRCPHLSSINSPGILPALYNAFRELGCLYVLEVAHPRISTIVVRPPRAYNPRSGYAPPSPSSESSAIGLTRTTPRPSCAHSERPALHSYITTTRHNPTPTPV